MRLLLISTLLLGSCTYDHATLEVRIYGEELIEVGIPADVFVDGWALRYEKFLVSVGEVEAQRDGVEGGLSEPNYQVFDLTRPSEGAGQRVASEPVVDGRYDATQFVIGPAADALAGNASAADLETMRAGGYSLYAAGQATKGDVTMRFAWGFATRTRYTACESLAEVGGAPARIELTIHGDHLFYDDLFSSTPNISFDLVANADADGDGEVTQAELLAVDLRPLANYQVGSTDIVDLWHFIEQKTTTVGHIDGEGHCEAARAT